LVAEAAESDGSFLHLFPTVAIVTNIESEHLEHYPDGFPQLLAAFKNLHQQLTVSTGSHSVSRSSERARAVAEHQAPLRHLR